MHCHRNAQRMLAQHEIAAGRLVTLSEITLRLGHPYSLVWPPSSQRKKGLLTLVEWLVSDGRGGWHGP
jgi:LysR family glycine cleavage system transcriptional activator